MSLLCFSLHGVPDSLLLDFNDTHYQIKDDLSFLETEDIVLGKITWEPHSVFLEEEFIYLTHFVSGHSLSLPICMNAYKNLQKKGLFDSVQFQIKKNNNRYDIHCNFKLKTVIKSVKLKGVSFAKEQYLQAYGLYAGDLFSFKQHEKALEQLQDCLKKEGYFNNKVESNIKKTKKGDLQITLLCKKGPKFTIGLLEVDFDGNHICYPRELKKNIKDQLHKKLLYKKYSDDLLINVTKEIKELLQKYAYLKNLVALNMSVDSQQKKVHLSFSIAPRIHKKFVFIGNCFFSEEDLLERFLRFEDSLSMLTASLFAEDLKSFYHKKGFWSTSIEAYDKDDCSFFIIKEGNRVTIDDIEVRDNSDSLSSMNIKKLFSQLLKQKFFDVEKLKIGSNNLVDWYQKKGYLYAKIINYDYKINKDVSYLLTITIDEGESFILESEDIIGYSKLLSQGPFSSFKKQTVCTFDFLQERKKWLQNYFKKKGYLSAHVSYEMLDMSNGKQLVWTIKKGEILTFGNTIIKGISPLHFNTLLRQLAYTKGDVWNKKSLQESQKRLKQLDIFKQIAFYPDASNTGGSRDILVSLQEDDPFEIRTRIGFSQVSKNFKLKKGSTYKFGGSFFFRNVSKHADIIQCDADITRFERKFAALYKRPCFLNTPFFLTTKLYAHNYTQPLTFGSRRTLYKTQQEGFLSSLSYQKKAISGALTTGFEWNKTTNISEDLAAAINFTADLIDKKVPYFFCEPTLFIDLLDNKLEPTAGCFMVAFLKGMIPLTHCKSSYSVKLLIEQGIFFPLIKDTHIIMALRAKFGHIFKESFSKIMPPERFYLGGANSLRGYLPDRCPPLGEYTDDSGQLYYVPQGGKSMLNMNMEVRCPLVQSLTMALFQDVGILVNDLKKINEDKSNLVATGVGLRYMTPFGPLRFDIGWKWKKSYPNDSQYAWFLTFGHAF